MLQLFNYWQDVFWGRLSEADGKEETRGFSSSTIGKTCSGEDRARLMVGESSKEQGEKKGKQLFDYWQKESWGRTGEADGRGQGTSSKEQGGATLRLLAIILLFLLHYSTQAPYGPSGHKDAPKGHHPIAQGSVLGRASQEEIAPCRGRIMPPPYSSISARLLAKLWMKLLEVSMGA